MVEGEEPGQKRRTEQDEQAGRKQLQGSTRTSRPELFQGGATTKRQASCSGWPPEGCLVLQLNELDSVWPLQRWSWRRLLYWDDRLPLSFVDQLWSAPETLLSSKGVLLKEDRRCTVVKQNLPTQTNGSPLLGSCASQSLNVASNLSSQHCLDSVFQRVDEHRPPAATKHFTGKPSKDSVDSWPVVIKQHRGKGPLHQALHTLWPTRAARGWRFGRLLRAYGVLTPAPLALLEERVGPLRFTSYLVTQFVEGRLLYELLETPEECSEDFWRGLANQFARLWYSLGRLRLLHRDFKATNFVVDNVGRLWLIDLDGMRRAATPVDFRLGRHTDWQRFFRNFERRPELAEVFRRAVETTHLKMKQQGTCWAQPKTTEWLAGAGVVGEGLHQTKGATVLRRLTDRENWRLDLAHPNGERRVFYLKRHFDHSGSGRSWNRSVERLQPPGPLEAAVTEQLKRSGVPTMNVVAAGIVEKNKRMESFVLSEELTGYTQLDHFLKQRFDKTCTWREPKLRQLIQQVAAVARLFHQAGYNHRDFYCCHFFVREESDGHFDIKLIDLQRVQRRKVNRRRWLVKDLAQLSYSAPKHCIGCKEKMLFIRHYFDVKKLGSAEKQLVRSVLRKHWLMEQKLGPHP